MPASYAKRPPPIVCEKGIMASRRGATPTRKTDEARPYLDLVQSLVQVIEAGRVAACRVVNQTITTTYWLVGRQIVEHEQGGSRRAGYGDELLERLSVDLTKRVGRGFSRRNLQQMRALYLWKPIRQTLSAKSTRQISQTSSAKFTPDELPPFPLPWSHYYRLLSVRDEAARAYYEQESIRGGWSVRQLDRQIASLAFQRTGGASSRLKAEAIGIDEAIRDPFVLEFLQLKDEYSETDLEDALIQELQQFLLELGNDFAFVARQKRLRVGDEWYRVDLLFFHRRLRCLVILDLKIGKFTYADAGQMNLYLNYAQEHWTHVGENPPVGLILCSEKDSAVAHYALGNLRNKVLAREYQLALPKAKELSARLKKARLLVGGQDA
jgi:predicted nuclease of restriction endonuclease-like (RecB) superfamily